MLRIEEGKLLDFCVSQRDRFDESAWHTEDCDNREQLGAAALFLSSVDWYGHQDELHRVATRMVPEWIERLADLARTHDFDLARFSQTLRHRLDHVATTA
ncbi:MAG: hypothetical protein ACKV19_10120 [Verrucomicrobiales bacterium]